jgi:hypothetical protein
MVKIGMDYNDRRIIHRLHKEQVATISKQKGRNVEAKINKGV